MQKSSKNNKKHSKGYNQRFGMQKMLKMLIRNATNVSDTCRSFNCYLTFGQQKTQRSRFFQTPPQSTKITEKGEPDHKYFNLSNNKYYNFSSMQSNERIMMRRGGLGSTTNTLPKIKVSKLYHFFYFYKYTHTYTYITYKNFYQQTLKNTYYTKQTHEI